MQTPKKRHFWKLVAVFLLAVIVIAIGIGFYISQTFYFSAFDDLAGQRLLTVTELPSNNPPPSSVVFQIRLGDSARNLAALGSLELTCISIGNRYTTAASAELAETLFSTSQIRVDGRVMLYVPSRFMSTTIFFAYYSCFNISNLPEGEHVISLYAYDGTIEYVQTWQILIEPQS